MYIWASLLICLVGALVHGYSNNAKAAALGLHMFWVGLFVFLWRFDEAVKFLSR
jgi:hypothetical protein